MWWTLWSEVDPLPTETQAALQQFACLGNIARSRCFRSFSGNRNEDVHSDLWDAVRLELSRHLEGSYKFIHDRIQEAAYSLIPERLRAEAHLRIGRLRRGAYPCGKNAEEAVSSRQSAQPGRRVDQLTRRA